MCNVPNRLFYRAQGDNMISIAIVRHSLIPVSSAEISGVTVKIFWKPRAKISNLYNNDFAEFWGQSFIVVVFIREMILQ